MLSPLRCFLNSRSHGAQSGNLRDGASPDRYPRKDCRPRHEAPPGRASARLWRRGLLPGTRTAPHPPGRTLGRWTLIRAPFRPRGRLPPAVEPR
eukprot:956950-Pyramimonas_sp.AAC.1